MGYSGGPFRARYSCCTEDRLKNGDTIMIFRCVLLLFAAVSVLAPLPAGAGCQIYAGRRDCLISTINARIASSSVLPQRKHRTSFRSSHTDSSSYGQSCSPSKHGSAGFSNSRGIAFIGHQFGLGYPLSAVAAFPPRAIDFREADSVDFVAVDIPAKLQAFVMAQDAPHDSAYKSEHPTTLAQLAPGAERSEHRTRQQIIKRHAEVDV